MGNLIETQFNIQRRLADYHFAQVTTWEEAKSVHARWMNDHNYQAHWARRQRDDGRLSPAEVLAWVRGRMWDPERVRRVFSTRRSLRKLDEHGCVRFRYWRLYGELGLARKTATLWLYDKTLTLEFANTPPSQVTVSYQPDRAHFRRITEPRLFETQYHSPQIALWDRNAVVWHLVQRLPEYAPRRRPRRRRKQRSSRPSFHWPRMADRWRVGSRRVTRQRHVTRPDTLPRRDRSRRWRTDHRGWA